jgi:hypothetical protein
MVSFGQEAPAAEASCVGALSAGMLAQSAGGEGRVLVEQRGVLAIADSHMAARHFLGLIDETVLWTRVMGDAKSLTDAEARDVVGQAVATLLGHYTAVHAPRPS